MREEKIIIQLGRAQPLYVSSKKRCSRTSLVFSSARRGQCVHLATEINPAEDTSLVLGQQRASSLPCACTHA